MQVDVDEKALKGFNEQARKELKKATEVFVEDVIKESNRIESASNPDGDDPQITSAMVKDAVVYTRKGLIQPKKGAITKALRVGAAVLSLIAGIMYDANNLQDQWYMLGFIVVVALAILAVTLSIIRE